MSKPSGVHFFSVERTVRVYLHAQQKALVSIWDSLCTPQFREALMRGMDECQRHGAKSWIVDMTGDPGVPSQPTLGDMDTALLVPAEVAAAPPSTRQYALTISLQLADSQLFLGFMNQTVRRCSTVETTEEVLTGLVHRAGRRSRARRRCCRRARRSRRAVCMVGATEGACRRGSSS